MSADDININNLDAFNDVEEIDPNAMVTDARPLPTPGTYSIRLGNAENGFKDTGKSRPQFTDRFPAKNVSSFTIQKEGPNKGKSYLQIAVTEEIISDNPKFNGQKRTNYVNTMVNRSTQTTAVDTYLRAITGMAGVGLSQKDKIEKLYDILATSPVITGEVDWRGESPKIANGQPVMRMDDPTKPEYDVATLNGKKLFHSASFPDGDSGGKQHADLTDDNGNSIYASWEVTKYMPAQTGAQVA